jgi:hypothetical protein
MAEKQTPKKEHKGPIREGQTKNNSKIISEGPKKTPPPPKAPPAQPKK